ncbi:MAG: hypothetical protein ACK5TP_08565 [bacterium]
MTVTAAHAPANAQTAMVPIRGRHADVTIPATSIAWSACRPKKCATRRSPPVVDQPTSGSPVASVPSPPMKGGSRVLSMDGLTTSRGACRAKGGQKARVLYLSPMRPIGILPSTSCDHEQILFPRLGSTVTRPRVAQA